MYTLLMKILGRLRLIDAVYVEDFDGEAYLRRAIKTKFGKYIAYTSPFPPATGAFTLLPNGNIIGPSYVERWKPYRIRKPMNDWLDSEMRDAQYLASIEASMR